MIITTLRRYSTVKRTDLSLSFLSGIKLLVASLRGIQVTNSITTSITIIAPQQSRSRWEPPSEQRFYIYGEGCEMLE